MSHKYLHLLDKPQIILLLLLLISFHHVASNTTKVKTNGLKEVEEKAEILKSNEKNNSNKDKLFDPEPNIDRSIKKRHSIEDTARIFINLGFPPLFHRPKYRRPKKQRRPHHGNNRPNYEQYIKKPIIHITHKPHKPFISKPPKHHFKPSFDHEFEPNEEFKFNPPDYTDPGKYIGPFDDPFQSKPEFGEAFTEGYEGPESNHPPPKFEELPPIHVEIFENEDSYHEDDSDHHEPEYEEIHGDFVELSHPPEYINSIAQDNIYRHEYPTKDVSNPRDKVHDGLEPAGLKGLKQDDIHMLADKLRPYV